MEKRLKKIREQMEEKGIEALLITRPVNRRYVTGFTGSSGWVVLTMDELVLITDFRYVEQVKVQAPHARLVELKTETMYTRLKEVCEEAKVSKLWFEADHLTFQEYERLKETLSIPLEPVTKLVETVRLQKDEQELQLIRKAVSIVDQAFLKVIEEIRPGMTEKQVANRLEFLMREMGAEGSAFDIIVASGARSALPHGVASDKVIEKGDLVTFDFGAVYQGYVSDLTRTIVLGKPDEKQKQIYDIVLKAGQKAIEFLRAGVSGKDADAQARDYIASHGFGEYFGHSTGHGIGLEVHEAPRLSMSSDDVLAEGMVVTVEPGIYLPGFGGVRIEEDVLITATGCEVLTQSPRELIIIE
jgi:Xaa-Pro aminopeptidase